jgi:hypothetical protein
MIMISMVTDSTRSFRLGLVPERSNISQPGNEFVGLLRFEFE